MGASKKPPAMTDDALVRELREFHHYESARRLEQLCRSHVAAVAVETADERQAALVTWLRAGGRGPIADAIERGEWKDGSTV